MLVLKFRSTPRFAFTVESSWLYHRVEIVKFRDIEKQLAAPFFSAEVSKNFVSISHILHAY
jgi:hypothetical protein